MNDRGDKQLSDGLYRTVDEEAGIVLYHGYSVGPCVWGIPIEETDLEAGVDGF